MRTVQLLHVDLRSEEGKEELKKMTAQTDDGRTR